MHGPRRTQIPAMAIDQCVPAPGCLRAPRLSKSASSLHRTRLALRLDPAGRILDVLVLSEGAVSSIESEIVSRPTGRGKGWEGGRDGISDGLRRFRRWWSSAADPDASFFFRRPTVRGRRHPLLLAEFQCFLLGQRFRVVGQAFGRLWDACWPSLRAGCIRSGRPGRRFGLTGGFRMMACEEVEDPIGRHANGPAPP